MSSPEQNMQPLSSQIWMLQPKTLNPETAYLKNQRAPYVYRTLEHSLNAKDHTSNWESEEEPRLAQIFDEKRQRSGNLVSTAGVSDLRWGVGGGRWVTWRFIGSYT